VFNTRFTVTDVTSISGLAVNIRRDDGVVIYLNGEEVVRDNMPAGNLNESSTAVSSIYGVGETAYTPLAIDATKLAEGVNVLSIAIHQIVPSSSDMSFDAEVVIDRLGPCVPLELDAALYRSTRLLGWDTQPGSTYTLECCDDLRIGTWTPLSTTTASGNRIEMADPTGAPVLQRVYRVRKD